MGSDDRYNGWTNRETWAVALYINNDQGWQESVLDALREARGEVVVGDNGYEEANIPLKPWQAGEIIRENVEGMFEEWAFVCDRPDSIASLWAMREDIGSLWRVNWDELGAAFLEDLEG